MPYVSNFEEINLRTYVTHDGRPGIYLLSVEANKLVPVMLSRLITGIPYIKSGIERNHSCLKVLNNFNCNAANLLYHNTELCTNKADLDYWLTERHCLYMTENKKLYCYNIHHKEWNLNDVIASISRLNYKVRRLNLGKTKPDKKHFSKKVKVLLWGKELVSVQNQK